MRAQLVQRRPRQFTGMHYTTNRRLVPQSILSLTSELERSLLRTILAGGGSGQRCAYIKGACCLPLTAPSAVRPRRQSMVLRGMADHPRLTHTQY